MKNLNTENQLTEEHVKGIESTLKEYSMDLYELCGDLSYMVCGYTDPSDHVEDTDCPEAFQTAISDLKDNVSYNYSSLDMTDCASMKEMYATYLEKGMPLSYEKFYEYVLNSSKLSSVMDSYLFDH